MCVYYIHAISPLYCHYISYGIPITSQEISQLVSWFKSKLPLLIQRLVSDHIVVEMPSGKLTLLLKMAIYNGFTH